MAAAFLSRGASLLADDVLPLRLVGGEVYGGPSIPLMKLWSDAVDCALDLRHELPNLTKSDEKKLLALDGLYPFIQEPVRLNAIYVLDRFDPIAVGHMDVTILTLSGRESLAALVEHTSDRSLLRPPDMARLFPLYARLGAQATIRRVSYPDGFEYQDEVYARIMADLVAR